MKSKYLLKLSKEWKNDEGLFEDNPFYAYSAQRVMASTIYKKYSKQIDKILKKIYKQIQKKPNKRYYYIDANKYSDDEVISIRNYFDGDFNISNTKPEDKAHIIYEPKNTSYTVAGINCSSLTYDSAVKVTIPTDKKDVIIKPASFYICW